MSEWPKMTSGEVYNAADSELLRLLAETRRKIRAYNDLMPEEREEQQRMIREILGNAEDSPHVNQPFRCDYGCNIHVGHRFFANFNLTILDEALVTFGDDVFIGSNVSLYTACHSTNPIERNTRREWALPITVGSNVWIGGSVTILPGVTIGDNVTIGAGSVVTHDIPANTVAVGNPCRVIRSIE